MLSLGKPGKGLVELKLDTDRGYKRATLCFNGKAKKYSVHRLVAEAFIPNPNNYPIVNHIDGNPSNNHVSNLEWCTFSHNERHSYKALGKINPIRKLTADQVKRIRDIGVIKKPFEKGGNADELAKEYGVDRSTIHNVIRRRYYVNP